jgi:hypothetical protein
MRLDAPESTPLPRPGKGVVFQRVPDGAVLFSTPTETYFGLNKVGAEAWELLPPATNTLGELTASLLERHPDADEQVVRSDIMELLDELRRLGLVVDGTGAGPDAASGS